MQAVPRNRYLIFIAIAVGGGLVDWVTKYYVFRWLGLPGIRPAWWIWQGVFGFQTSLNEGALFGLGQGRTFVFAALSIAAAGGILYWLFVARAAVDRLLTISLAMITGGIAGNLYDRLGLPGLTWHFSNSLHKLGEPVYAVRDWILVMFGKWPWPNFNVADSLLVCGAILLACQALRKDDATMTERIKDEG
jgi:signal peptidase II